MIRSSSSEKFEKKKRKRSLSRDNIKKPIKEKCKFF